MATGARAPPAPPAASPPCGGWPSRHSAGNRHSRSRQQARRARGAPSPRCLGRPLPATAAPPNRSRRRASRRSAGRGPPRPCWQGSRRQPWRTAPAERSAGAAFPPHPKGSSSPAPAPWWSRYRQCAGRARSSAADRAHRSPGRARHRDRPAPHWRAHLRLRQVRPRPPGSPAPPRVTTPASSGTPAPPWRTDYPGYPRPPPSPRRTARRRAPARPPSRSSPHAANRRPCRPPWSRATYQDRCAACPWRRHRAAGRPRSACRPALRRSPGPATSRDRG